MKSRIVIPGNPAEVLRQLRDAFNFGMPVDKIQTGENVLLVLQDQETDETIIQAANNIVTNTGDLYYAQLGAGETPTNAVVGMRLGSNNTAPTKTDADVNTFVGVGHNIDATYPKTNDGDANNTGAGTDIVSWSASWLTSENNVAMLEGAIVDNITTPTVAHCRFTFTDPSKTSSQTLQVFVNHTMNGV